MNDEVLAKPGDTRPRGKNPFRVWVTPEERAKIERLAATTGLSASAYLRTLGLGYQPKSTLDAKHVCELLKLGGDMGRLGGLLKLWLVEQPGRAVLDSEVRLILNEIMELRGQIADKVAAL